MLGRRRGADAASTDAAVGSSRYDGKPFLRLLECYVLNAAGVLPADAADRLSAMEPNLATTYNRPGLTRVQIVEAEMDFPDTLWGSLRQMWQGTLQSASESVQEVDADQWAQAVVDQNFV